MLFEIVDDAAGCADQNIQPLFNRFALTLVASATVREPQIEFSETPQCLGIAVDLNGQFTGGGKNQGAGLVQFFPAGSRVFDQPIHGCQQECSRFSGAGLGLSGNVISLECQW